MRVFADTSFLLSLYMEDSHSRAARDFMIKLARPVALTPFNEFEFAQALRLALHRKLISASEVAGAEASLERDRSEGFFLDSGVLLLDVLKRARRLAIRRTAMAGCRSMDLLHVAAALEQKATHLLTFDTPQKNLAESENLKTSL